jgi:voltage-gated potassium channel Kch
MRFRHRLRSWFDSTMDRGTPALIGWLALASLLLVTAVTALAALFASDEVHEKHGGWLEVAWMSLLRTLDPGTMGGDDGSPMFLALMLTATIGGIFLVSSLIGVLTTGLEKRIGELRKGRSRVSVRGHAVLLGWSEQVFVVVSELVKANQGGRSTVVILAPRDKVAMEDAIRARVGDTGSTRIICRSGNPLKRQDLELASLDTARSIMVLSPPRDDADIDVIKVLLLLNNRPWPPNRPHVVAAVQESQNMAAARLAGGSETLLVDADDMTVRLVVQSHRQSGLSTVCTDLLDFSGNEIYMRTEPSLVGSTYAQVLAAYEIGCPIGLHHGAGEVTLNPGSDFAVSDADQIILVAEDDLLMQLAEEPAAIVEEAIVAEIVQPEHPDRTLLLGWNSRGPKILDLLDRLVLPGSTVDIAAAARPNTRDGYTNLTIGHRPGDPTSRAALEALDLGAYQHIVVLADDTVDADHADDRTLVTLLHLRDIEVGLGDPFAIVSEMNDDDNREVAQVTKADDFVVGSKIISLLMTQLAENRHLHAVFADLFDPSGCEIYVKPAANYVTADVPVNFATIVESARRRGETAIGYRLKGRGEQPPNYGVVLNPPKSDPLTLSGQDSIVVVAVD